MLKIQSLLKCLLAIGHIKLNGNLTTLKTQYNWETAMGYVVKGREVRVSIRVVIPGDLAVIQLVSSTGETLVSYDTTGSTGWIPTSKGETMRVIKRFIELCNQKFDSLPDGGPTEVEVFTEEALRAIDVVDGQFVYIP